MAEQLASATDLSQLKKLKSTVIIVNDFYANRRVVVARDGTMGSDLSNVQF